MLAKLDAGVILDVVVLIAWDLDLGNLIGVEVAQHLLLGVLGAVGAK